MEPIHEAVINEVLEYARTHLVEALTVTELARKAGYSSSRLRHIFHSATGRGLLPHLLDMRIDKAKKLLCNTKMPASDIAFEVGFRSPKQFSTLFRKKVGCSPGVFRRCGQEPISTESSFRSPGDERWYFNSFKGVEWNQDFVVHAGDWRLESECISGRADEAAMISFHRPLPENFRLSIEVRPLSHAGLPCTEFEIRLQDQTEESDYCGFVLGKFGGSTGELRPYGLGSQLNPDAVLVKDRWQRVQLELKDDTVRLSVDGTDRFVHRDPFPPPFSKRSHIAFLTYMGHIQLRNLEVTDLGFFTLIKNIRRGDSLYNAGLYSPARDFYVRLLQSEASMADTMELRYKIGKCFRAEEDFLQARNWMEKVVGLPEESFWADQAKLALFELDIREGRLAGLSQTIAEMFRKEPLRHGIRETVDISCAWLMKHGYYEKACFLRECLFRAEGNGNYLHLHAERQLGESLFLLRRYHDSEIHFRSVTADSALLPIFRAPMLFNLGDSLCFQGKFAEWWNLLEEVRPIVEQHPFDLCRLHIHRAFYYRATGEYEKAINELSVGRGKLPANNPLNDLAKIHAARILLCEEKEDEARGIAEEWKDSSSYPEYKNSTLCLLELLQGNFSEAAQVCLHASQNQRESHVGAEWAIKAGILWGLAANKAEAERIWKRTSEFYIPERYNFIGSLAEGLLNSSTQNVEQMPYPPVNRSEMFLFLGLFCESKGENARAKELFQLCFDEDKAADLPAVLARKKLALL